MPHQQEPRPAGGNDSSCLLPHGHLEQEAWQTGQLSTCQASRPGPVAVSVAGGGGRCTFACQPCIRQAKERPSWRAVLWWEPAAASGPPRPLASSRALSRGHETCPCHWGRPWGTGPLSSRCAIPSPKAPPTGALPWPGQQKALTSRSLSPTRTPARAAGPSSDTREMKMPWREGERCSLEGERPSQEPPSPPHPHRGYLIISLVGGGAFAPRNADAQTPRLAHNG